MMKNEILNIQVKNIGFNLLMSVVLLTGLLSGSCKSKKDQPEAKPVITVSVLPQKYFVDKIAGDKFDVQVMIPSTGSCETYEPEPKQLEGLLHSKVYFSIGYIHFETTWIEKFRSTAPGVRIADMSKGIVVQADQSEHEEPHLWLSAKSAKIMAGNILAELISVDPQNTDFFTSNYKKFIIELDTLDSEITRLLEPISNRKFLIYHPALLQFANDYGFTQVPVEYEGKSPSPFAIEQLINRAKSEKIKLIFIQEQFDLEHARLISKETGAVMVSFNPMDFEWHKQMLLIAGSLQKYCE